LECGGKRSATPLWIRELRNTKKSKAPPLSAHSKFAACDLIEEFFSSLLRVKGAEEMALLRLERVLEVDAGLAARQLTD
jgi:hypothetical protein